MDIKSLENLSKETRKKIFKMAYKSGGAHLGGAYSIVEILVSMYFGGILKFDPKNPYLPERDRFILSKGHAAIALYAVLARAGYFDENELYTFCQEDSRLGGHPKMYEVPGVEASTGALGHGLGFGTGIALAGKIDKRDYGVYVLLGDGECQEGSIWEGALFASSRKLDNLTVILDNNKLQAMDELEKIVKMDSFTEKWKSFGWYVQEVDGHNITELVNTLNKKNESDKPRIIIADTVKGKGISFMENVPIWHFRMPDDEELKTVLEELELTMEELQENA